MKTLERFIEEHKLEIISGVNAYLNHVPATASCNCPRSGTEHTHADDNMDVDDEDVKQWILNDESLYNWARGEGVDI